MFSPSVPWWEFILRAVAVRKVLDDEKITYDELIAALRHSGSFELSDVKLALLETNGSVSVWRREPEAHASAAS